MLISKTGVFSSLIIDLGTDGLRNNKFSIISSPDQFCILPDRCLSIIYFGRFETHSCLNVSNYFHRNLRYNIYYSYYIYYIYKWLLYEINSNGFSFATYIFLRKPLYTYLFFLFQTISYSNIHVQLHSCEWQRSFLIQHTHSPFKFPITNDVRSICDRKYCSHSYLAQRFFFVITLLCYYC